MSVWHNQDTEPVTVPDLAGGNFMASVQGHQIVIALEMYHLGRGLLSIKHELPGS